MTAPLLADVLTEPQEQSLVEALAACIANVGVDRFLTCAVVAPASLDVRIAEVTSLDEVGRVLSVLLDHAGVPAEVAVHAAPAELAHLERSGSIGTAWQLHGPAVVFDGSTAGPHPSCRFVVDKRACRDAGLLLGSAARAVAAALRAIDGHPTTGDMHDDDVLVDLTALSLGFGALLAQDVHCSVDIADWPLRGPESMGNMAGAPGAFASNTDAAPQRVALAKNGGLSPRALAAMFGTVVAVRGLDARSVSDALDANQASWVADTVASLRAPDVLAARIAVLGLPPSSTAPSLTPDEGSDLPARAIIVHDADVSADVSGDVSDEAPVFRVMGSEVLRGVVVGALSFGAVALVHGFVPLPFGAWIGAMAAIPLMGLLGLLVRRARCTTCSTLLSAQAERCPGCRGRVVGAVAHRNDRLKAEEEYFAWRAQLPSKR